MKFAEMEIVTLKVSDVITTSGGCKCFVAGPIDPNADNANDEC